MTKFETIIQISKIVLGVIAIFLIWGIYSKVG